MGLFDFLKKNKIKKDSDLILVEEPDNDKKAVAALPPDFPVFKYHKNPLDTKAFVKSNKSCFACGQKRGWGCTETIKAEDVFEDGFFCPWCVYDGSAAEKFKSEFVSLYEENPGISQDCIDELTHRTPSILTWQDFEWPAHCNDFYEFINYVTWDDITKLGIEKELEQDLLENEWLREANWTVSELKEVLCKGSSLQGYLFRCLHCGKYHLHIDAD